MNLEKEKIIPKTEVRNNFASYYEKAKNGEVLVISDRGDLKVALVPIAYLEGSERKNTPSIKTLKIFGIWNDRKDITSGIAYEDKIRKSMFSTSRRHNKE